ncbi:TonB-dependent receptor [Roseateles sp. BYS87W]|uniref:TonB-dependent receptor n=1 Tax=Pelomonas baiyunensis TaxID=3299026 RepID=A0ABW7GST1_9BURK
MRTHLSLRTPAARPGAPFWALTICAAAAASFGLAPSAWAQAPAPLQAADTAPDALPDAAVAPEGGNVLKAVEVSVKRTRSSTRLTAQDVQALLPGTNPIKALQTLPGVSYQTADPWGNNEQNASLFIHGFSTQQLGYTLDGVPLGDQQYGNYNGLSPQRAISSENVRGVLLSSGAGDLATASTSNLGGTIETFSSDPLAQRRVSLEQTLGSYAASRTFVRVDTGAFGEGNSAYVSFLRQDARAWDFNGEQGGKQVNGKFVRATGDDKLTLYFNYNDKIEPNEDSIVRSSTEAYQPATRPFFYPDLAGYLAYLNPTTSATPAAEGNNYRNYYSAAQRTDWLGYAKYDARLSERMVWTNQAYYHRDQGAGLVAGPIGVAGLPGLFGVYFPNQNLKQVFGNSGIALRTTEYAIHRGGVLSRLDAELDDHHLQAGLWVEQNRSSAYRRWYAFDINNPTSPYDKPTGHPLITQYGSEIDNKVVQLYLQDAWTVQPGLTLQAGFKSSLQFAQGRFPVQQKAGSITGNSPALPEGKIDTRRWFLPQIGAVWDVTARDQLYANVQQNLRQFVTYGAGGLSPWSLSSQAGFDLFKATAKPETSVTYDAGYRIKRRVDSGVLTELDAQFSVYHVDFHNRLLQIASTPVISSINPGNPILANVGGVSTNGVDISGTLRFAGGVSFYNAVSYNRSVYNNDYQTGASGATVATQGKQVPGSPQLLEKFVLTLPVGGVEAQLIGDYVGKRYATFTNDKQVSSYFLTSLSLTARLPMLTGELLKDAKLRLTVSNVANKQGDLNVVVGSATNTFNTYPIPPRQAYLTFSTAF